MKLKTSDRRLITDSEYRMFVDGHFNPNMPYNYNFLLGYSVKGRYQPEEVFLPRIEEIR